MMGDQMLIREDYFKNIFNTVREAILILDENMRVLSANRSFFNIFKVDSANTVGSLLYDLGNGQWNIPHLRMLLEDILPKNETVDDFAIEHNFESIGHKTMLLNACKLREKNSDEPIILLAIEDITESRRLEDVLTESEERYRRIFETASDGIVLLDKREGNITHANLAVEKMLGYSKEECIGKKLQDIGVSIDMSDFPAVMQVLDESSIINYADVPVETRSGQYIYADIYIVDRARLAQCNIRDVSERKRDEERLRKSEEFTKNILQSVDEGFIVLDLEYRVIAANRAYLNFIGKTLEEVMGKHCYELAHHADKPCCEAGTAACPVTLTFKTGEHYSSFHTHFDNTGAPVYVETKSYPMKDESGKVVSAIEIINDITDKKKLEAQLLQAQKMEAVGLLAGGIAHDFNNVLSAIVGYGYLLQTNMKSDDPLREHVDQILVSADRAAEVTHSLLAFSKKQILTPKPVNINAMIKRFEKFLSRLIGEDIDLSANFSDEDVTSMADAGKIEQVLLNLATNARDAMPHGGHLTLDTQLVELDDAFIRVHGYGEPGMFAVISVSDTGRGMGKETMARIFEPFFTTKEVGKGTGLGLAMAYGIIKQHKGYITVYSEPEKGTTFRIYLPAIKTTEEVIVKTAMDPLPSRGDETILVAEDDSTLRKLFSTVLQSYGYKVILAEDGEEAIKKFMDNKDKFQLVMLDMIMPKKNGKEAYDGIKKIRPDMKTLFSSGYTADRIDKDSMLKEGFDFIMKPVSPKDLLKKIREVLDR
jgi:PAS domain S-box-containing protein